MNGEILHVKIKSEDNRDFRIVPEHQDMNKYYMWKIFLRLRSNRLNVKC